MLAPKAQYNLADAKKYFKEHLAVGDYYAEGQTAPGQWIGKGAADLGLSGVTTTDEFVRLCENLHPQTGERLTLRQKTTRMASHGITLECANRFNLRELTDPRSLFDRLVNKWGAQRVYRSGLAWGKDGVPERLIWGTPALLFPFHQNGSVIYVQARMFEGERKYLNPRGIAKPLCNADRLANLPAGSLLHICEGVPDTLAMEAHGLNAVGVLGATSFRPDWVDPFLRFKVAVLGHGDAAGEKFAADIYNFFCNRGKSVWRIPLPKGKDAADILAKVGETSRRA